MITENSVVLPAPFGPSSAAKRPRPTRDRHVVQRRARAEAVADMLDQRAAAPHARAHRPSDLAGIADGVEALVELALLLLALGHAQGLLELRERRLRRVQREGVADHRDALGAGGGIVGGA